jgi:hypothetical protein
MFQFIKRKTDFPLVLKYFIFKEKECVNFGYYFSCLFYCKGVSVNRNVYSFIIMYIHVYYHIDLIS